jgi:hypothetical protein
MKTALEYLFAYLVVCLGGHYVVAALMYWMRRITLKLPRFWDWSVFFTGITERAVALTLVLFAPPYLASFIGGLKFAANWKRRDPYKESTLAEEIQGTVVDQVAQGSMLFLIGNVLSFAIAIAVGVALNPKALDVWATAH